MDKTRCNDFSRFFYMDMNGHTVLQSVQGNCYYSHHLKHKMLIIIN